MDIEELQAVWSEMSDQLEKQKKLTNEIIMTMTQERYTNKFKKIATYETIGAFICFATAVFILLNIAKLNTWYLLTSGIIILIIITILPVLSLRSIAKIKRINIIDNNYKQTIVSYAKAKKNLLMVQQFSTYSSLFIFFTSIPVASKLISNKDIFMMDKPLWYYIFVSAVAVFVVLFARWGFRCYKNITNSAENILKELEK